VYDSDCANSWWQVHLVQVTFDPDLQGQSKVQLIRWKYEYMSIYYLNIMYCSLTTAYVAVDCMSLDCIGAELFSKTCRRFYPGTVCVSGSSSCCLKSLGANLPWPEMDLMIGAALDTLLRTHAVRPVPWKQHQLLLLQQQHQAALEAMRGAGQMHQRQQQS
jgi:hypothetical protein